MTQSGAQPDDIEVVYARPDAALVRRVSLPPGSTIAQAIEQSGILRECPEVNFSVNRVGIFGKRAELTAPVQPGDRVEIYRPLTADPKESRRRRAEHARRMKKR